MARKKKQVDVSDVEIVDENQDMKEITEIEAAIEAGEQLELIEETEPTKEEEPVEEKPEVKAPVKSKAKTKSKVAPVVGNPQENTEVPRGTFQIFFS